MQDRLVSGKCKDRKPASQRVHVPPSRHISVPFWALVKQIAGSAEQGQGRHYEAVSKLLDSIALHEFQLVRRRLKQNFKPFLDAASGKKSYAAVLQHEELEEQEVDFLEDFYSLLQAAHFKVLTEEEWHAAKDNDFTFTNPLEVAWDHMERRMLHTFWQKREDEFANAASISEKVLVMHRGAHLSKAKGVFLEDKIDFLVLYLIAGPFERLFKPLYEAYSQGEWHNLWPKFSIVESKSVGYSRHSTKPSDEALKQLPPTHDPLLDHENAKWVERVTLKDLMPNASAVFKLLFKEVTIQEPTFRETLILYRRDAQSQVQKKDEKAPINDTKPEDLAKNIHIKRFQNIPMADLEMIFPDKKVYLKPLLLIQLLVTIVVGLISVFVTVLSTEASWSLIGGVLSIIGTRAFQVWTAAQLGRQKVLDQITDRLYEQTMDAQDGVIYFLLDQMADQHVKELMLAYFILLKHGKPLTEPQLDKECEEYLKQDFGEAVDFALENSLPVLLKDGLITKDSQGYLSPVRIEEAERILVAKGQESFTPEAFEENPEQQQPQRFKLPIFAKLSTRKFGRQEKVKPAAAEKPVPGTDPQIASHSLPDVSSKPTRSSPAVQSERPAIKPTMTQPLGTAAPSNLSEGQDVHGKGSKLASGLKSIFKHSKKEA